MAYKYYIFNHYIFRLEKGHKLSGDINSLQVQENENWIHESKRIQSFMNHYVTGWIDEDDAVESYEIAKQLLISSNT